MTTTFEGRKEFQNFINLQQFDCVRSKALQSKNYNLTYIKLMFELKLKILCMHLKWMSKTSSFFPYNFSYIYSYIFKI